MDELNCDGGREAFYTSFESDAQSRPSIRRVYGADRDEILDWINGHKIEITGLPKVGFRSSTVACFLNQAECGIASIDHLVKRPGSSDNLEEGILCIKACIDWAKENGFTYIYAVSHLNHIVKYSEVLGFKKWPHKYLVLENN